MKYSIILMFFLIISCKPAPAPVSIKEETPIPIVIPITDEIVEARIWSALEYKLPIGDVIQTDFAHGDKNKEQNMKDNYVTIKRFDNTLTIVKDIDEDLFLNIRVGDKIR